MKKFHFSMSLLTFPGGTRDPSAAPPDWKTLVPQPPDTESRRSYQPQPMAPDLMDFTRKYGCNAKHRVAVKGAGENIFGREW